MKTLVSLRRSASEVFLPQNCADQSHRGSGRNRSGMEHKEDFTKGSKDTKGLSKRGVLTLAFFCVLLFKVALPVLTTPENFSLYPSQLDNDHAP
jgi:hypothetical protein